MVFLTLVSLLFGFLTPAQEAAPTPKKAIIVGASVEMGKELAKMLAADGYIVGMTARRIEALQELQDSIPTPTYAAYMDASQPEQATEILSTMITDMGGLDLLVLAPTGFGMQILIPTTGKDHYPY